MKTMDGSTFPGRDRTLVLIVDDEPALVKNIAAYLEDRGYDSLAAANGATCLSLLEHEKPAAILLDLRMPEMDGFSLLRRLKDIGTHEHIPIIIVSGVGNMEDAIACIRLGAWDYITKPIHDLEVLDHVLSRCIERARLLEEKQHYQERLEAEVKRRTKDLEEEIAVRIKVEERLQLLNQEIADTQREIVLAIGEVVESRSKETANHVRRVMEFSCVLARHLKMDSESVELLRAACPMHDVGKIAIPDAILNKPGSLNTHEYEIMKTHTLVGYDILRHSQRTIMKAAATIALQHHERWDGFGYPNGTEGRYIDFFARLTAAADVFDALSHRRIYKEAWPLDAVIDYFAEERGKAFDPDIVDAFFDCKEDFIRILKEFPDPLYPRPSGSLGIDEPESRR